MHRLISAIKNRHYFEALGLLRNGQYDVNAQLLAETMPDKYAQRPDLPIRTLVHLAVATNHPKLLAAMVSSYNGNIRQLEQAVPIPFIKILLNRTFDTPVKTKSALSNLSILCRNGATIPNTVVIQLFVDYDHSPNPATRDNLRKIIRKIYLMKAMDAFLDHIRNNRIPEARAIRNSDISVIYPEVARLGFTGKIDPNYDAGFRGAAVLVAAELGDNAINMFEFMRTGWYRQNDFRFQNKEGVTVAHVLAMNGSEHGLRWFCDEFPAIQVLQTLTKTVNAANGQRLTPMDLATIHNSPQVVAYLRAYMNSKSTIILEEAVNKENPDKLKLLKKAGYDFAQVHTGNQGNALHYAVLGRVPANLPWLWNELGTDQKRLEFLLGKMQFVQNGHYQMLSPLQLAIKFNRANVVNILNRLCIQLARSVAQDDLYQLLLAGYNLNGTDVSGRTVLHYGIAGNNANGLGYLLNLMPVVDVVKVLEKRQHYKNDQNINSYLSPLEAAHGNNAAMDVQRLFQKFRQLCDPGVNVPNSNPLAIPCLNFPTEAVVLPNPINIMQVAQPFMPMYAVQNQLGALAPANNAQNGFAVQAPQ